MKIPYKVPLNGHAFELASGRQLTPGEIEKLSEEEEEENKDLIDEAIKQGRLFKIEEVAMEDLPVAELRTIAAQNNVEGADKMNKDQLLKAIESGGGEK